MCGGAGRLENVAFSTPSNFARVPPHMKSLSRPLCNLQKWEKSKLIKKEERVEREKFHVN
jgi:hypothetical protein